MLVAYLSPLAPAAILLLSAFILSVVVPRLPPTWLATRRLAYWIGPGLVGIAALTLLGLRLSFDQDSSGAPPDLLSGWDFSGPEAVVGLSVQTDQLSLSFSILALILLSALALLTAPYRPKIGQPSPNSELVVDEVQSWGYLPSWLVLGAGTCLLYVSGNLPTLGYAVLTFDLLLVIFWLNRGHSHLGVARLFLGILTATAFSLVEVAPSTGLVSGIFLLSSALWVRLGLYPFIEMTTERGWNENQRLIYLGFSVAVGIYLVIRVLDQPVPSLIGWLTTITLGINGLLAWLAERRSVLLSHLVIAEVLLLLLLAPLPYWVSIAYGLGLILSMVALGITPPLERPHSMEKAKFWLYIPAVAATLTLFGFPLSLGWFARLTIYESLLLSKSMLTILVVIVADVLALSGLVGYWQSIIWQNNNVYNWRSAIGIVVAVPFLIPFAAPYALAMVTMQEAQLIIDPKRAGFWVVLLGVTAGAVGLGYYRGLLLSRLRISPLLFARVLQLRWLFPKLEGWLSRAGKLVLRINIVIEGRHYIGWAIFAVIVGTLLILLRT